MEQHSSTTVLKLFAVLGGLALIAILSSPIVFMYFALRNLSGANTASQTQTVTTTTSILGEPGARCGGPARLPCKPGTICSTEGAGDYGTCITVPQNTSTEKASGQLGASCADTACGTGLYCQKVKTTCAKIDATAPYAQSVKVTGATFENSVYQVPVDASSTVEVQAVNADTVTMELVPAPGFGAAGVSQWLGQPHKGKGGAYSAVFKPLEPFQGSIRVVVTAKNGDSSAVTVDIASVK